MLGVKGFLEIAVGYSASGAQSSVVKVQVQLRAQADLRSDPNRDTSALI